MQEAAKRVSAEASLTNDEDLFTTGAHKLSYAML